MKNCIKLFQKLFLAFIVFFVSTIQVFSQIVYIDENIQDWVNRSKYGDYTQPIAVGSSQADVILSNCIVAKGATAKNECSVGRIQIKELDGIVEFPELPNISVIQLGLVAGAKDRELSLQYFNATEWQDLIKIEGISTEGKLFTFNIDFDSPTKLRLTAANKTVYLHDIKIIGGDPNCTSANLQFDISNTISKYVGDKDFTIEATSNNKAVDIVYNSSNPQVASVNPQTGEVTVLSIGTTTINAFQNEGEYNNQFYCTAHASYNLQITLSEKSLLFVEKTFSDFKTYAGGSCSATFTLKGINLKSDVNLELKGTDASSFKLSHNTIEPIDGTIDDVEVKITYEPYVAKEDVATLCISSNSEDSIELELIGCAVELVSDGSLDIPFLVSDVKILNNAYASNTKYWVKGYIVGIPTQGNANGNLTTVKTEYPFVGQTAIALADDQDEKDFSKMIGVQLLKGDIRDMLNLEENPDNFNRKVMVYGTLEAYFSNAPGVKNISDYKFDVTSMSESNECQTRVYINQGILMLELTEREEITIYNLLGNEVYRKQFEQGIHQIRFLKTGTYIIKSANLITKICLF